MNELNEETRLEMDRRLWRQLTATRRLMCGDPEEQERAWLAAEQSLLESEAERLSSYGDASWGHDEDYDRRT